MGESAWEGGRVWASVGGAGWGGRGMMWARVSRGAKCLAPLPCPMPLHSPRASPSIVATGAPSSSAPGRHRTPMASLSALFQPERSATAPTTTTTRFLPPFWTLGLSHARAHPPPGPPARAAAQSQAMAAPKPVMSATKRGSSSSVGTHTMTGAGGSRSSTRSKSGRLRRSSMGNAADTIAPTRHVMHSRLDHVDTLKEVYEFGIKLGQGR